MIQFDALRYIASNPDLIKAYGANEELGRLHWEEFGKAEGRSFTSFDPLIYSASHLDLARVYGTDARALMLHYITAGFHEGRPVATFKPAEYVAANPDLAAVGFGSDPVKATLHYLEHGFKEGRPTNPAEAFLNPLVYIASYPDLIKAFGANPQEGRVHWEVYGEAEGRMPAVFKPLIYGASHPELALKFGADVKALTIHYITTGYSQGKSMGTFDPAEYVAANPDLAARGFGNDLDKAVLHYLTAGVKEGRPTEPSAEFDGLRYIASHPDLIAALGADERLGDIHWTDSGRAEGRSPTLFDPLLYGASNPDLALAFGANTAALSQHYITTGFREGRETSGFDAQGYLAANGDLAAVFEDDVAGALYHYLLIGVREGRSTEGAIGVIEDNSYTLRVSDFEGLQGSVTILSLPNPAAGTLYLAGEKVAAGASVSEAQIKSGMFVYLPAQDVFGAAGNSAFTYKVEGQAVDTMKVVMSTRDYTDITGLTSGVDIDPLGPRAASAVLWSGGSQFKINFATTPETTFETFNIKRIGTNLEFSWTIEGEARTFTLLGVDQRFSASQILTFGGGDIAGYELKSSYVLYGGGLADFGQDAGVSTDVSTTTFTGGSSDMLFANGGDDRLEGRGGDDLFVGGLGKDIFIYQRIDTPADTILDFTPGEDKLELYGKGTFYSFMGFAGLSGPLQPNQLVASPNAAPVGTHAQLNYNTSNGQLFYDSDGVGGAAPQLFVTLVGAPAISTSDFLIVDVGNPWSGL